MAADVAHPVSDREIRHHDLPERPLSDRARALVEEAEVTDRANRFGHRHAHVTTVNQKRSRRSRQVSILIAVTLAVAGAALGAAVADMTGAVVGLTLPAAALGARTLMHRAARRRGAEGFDWRTGRHVLTSNPAREVQDWDDPRSR